VSDLSLWPAADRHYIAGGDGRYGAGTSEGLIAYDAARGFGGDGGFSEVGRGVFTDLQLTEVVGQIRSRRG